MKRQCGPMEYQSVGDLTPAEQKRTSAIGVRIKKYLEKDSSNAGLLRSVADFEIQGQ